MWFTIYMPARGYIQRAQTESKVRSALMHSPAVVLLGARQVGKSTLAKRVGASIGRKALYLDLERQADLRKLDDPDTYLRRHASHLVIIDEIHRAPGLFPELRGIIDDRRAAGNRTGQFLLLGSASLDLMHQSSESLAGRVTYIDLDPINLTEASAASLPFTQLWLRGGFPDSLLAANDDESFIWRESFIQSYLERDVPMFAPQAPAAMIGRLWTMLANGQGTMLNQARLGQSLGVTAPTVNRYLDLLIDLKLLRRLQPWSGNIGKRLMKAPKVYVRDSGLVHALLEISDYDQLLGHPVCGPSWEGFVIENLIAAAGPRRTPFFYRTSNGAEIDLVIEKAGKPVLAVEVKRSSAPKIDPGFVIACDDLKIKDRIIVYSGDETYPIRDGISVHSLSDAIQHVTKILGTAEAIAPARRKVAGSR